MKRESNVLEAGDKLYWDGRAWRHRAGESARADELAPFPGDDSADRDVLDPGRVA